MVVTVTMTTEALTSTLTLTMSLVSSNKLLLLASMVCLMAHWQATTSLLHHERFVNRIALFSGYFGKLTPCANAAGENWLGGAN
jgi:hypothetical protein